MKKPSVVSFLITLLLAAAVCIQGRDYVTDKDGNDVKIHEQYFIQPIKKGSNSGGGLVPAAINILPFCPLGITQTLLPDQPGLPVILRYPYGVMEPSVPIDYYVNIEFKSDIWPVCNEYSKFWEVNDSSSAIVIGGEPTKNSSWFKIERSRIVGAGPNIFKLTTLTGTVGTIPGPWGGAPQLVVTNDTAKTLLVRFSKVDDATTATTSTSRVEKLGLRMFPFL